MTSPTKNVNPKLLKFLKIESRRHSTSLEGLNKSLAQSAAELWLNKFWPILANKTFCGTLRVVTWNMNVEGQIWNESM